MKTRALYLVAILAASLTYGIAYADAGVVSNPDAPPNLAALYPMFGMVLALAWGYLSRKLSTAEGFFHTAFGHGIITLAGAVVGSIVPIFKAGHPTWVSLAWAALGAGSAFFAALNGSIDGNNDSKLRDKAQDVIKAVLLPLLFVGALLAQGCAFGLCELGKLPQTLQSVIAAVVAIGSQPSGYVEDLTTLGIDVGPGQVDCIAQAIASAATAPKGALAAHRAVNVLRDHLQEYLAARRAKGARITCGPEIKRAVGARTWASAGPPSPDPAATWNEQTRFAVGLAVVQIDPDCKTVKGYWAPFTSSEGLPPGSSTVDGTCITGEREVPWGRIKATPYLVANDVPTKGCQIDVVRCDHKGGE